MVGRPRHDARDDRRPLRQARPRLRRERGAGLRARRPAAPAAAARTRASSGSRAGRRSPSTRSARSRADRRFDDRQGDFDEEIAPLEKPVTIEMCKTFSPGTNYHNDAEEAKKLGFPDIVVQGMMPICFLSEFMTRRFGEGWFAGGRMEVQSGQRPLGRRWRCHLPRRRPRVHARGRAPPRPLRGLGREARTARRSSSAPPARSSP